MGGELMENQLKLASCQKSRLMKAQRVPSAGDEQRSVWDGCVFYLWQSEQKRTS